MRRARRKLRLRIGWVPVPPGIVMVAPPEVPRNTGPTQHGEGLGHRGGVERRAGGWSSDPMIEADVRARGCCRYRLAWCARPTGDRYVRTTDAPAQRIKAYQCGRRLWRHKEDGDHRSPEQRVKPREGLGVWGGAKS